MKLLIPEVLANSLTVEITKDEDGPAYTLAGWLLEINARGINPVFVPAESAEHLNAITESVSEQFGAQVSAREIFKRSATA